jgi:hypothetical protein
MAVALHFDADVADDERRTRLYRGELFVYAPRPATLAFCKFAREQLRAAFHPLDPELAQHELPVERFAAVLAELKPRFIHHPESKRWIRAVLAEFGCDPEQTYFDVPRLRSSTSDGYLTSGIAYAFHPHRDTWYSAPLCQLNWWLPVSELREDNGVAFHPRYFTQPLRNGSRGYDYAEWNRTRRFTAASQIGRDTRPQPRPEEPVDLACELRPLPRPGGVLLFSAAQLHSSVPNTSGRTRYSIDFRTVHRAEAERGAGAPNLDSSCTGTALGDFMRASDLARLPGALVAAHAAGFGRGVPPGARP